MEASQKKLISTEELEYTIELVIMSGYISNADPLSLIISAQVGAGKTEILKLYRKTPGVQWLTEPTAFGVKERFLGEIESGKIKHLIIGDLLTPLSKQKRTRDDFIAFFNALIEEGVGSIHTFAQHWEGSSFAKCGIMTSIAQPDLLRKSRRWYEIGFLSRAIPLTYSYSPATEAKIYREIATSGDIREFPIKNIDIPEEKYFVKPNKSLNLRLIEISMRMEEWEKVYGFRRQEQLQTLMMANALKNYRFEVIEEDYEAVLDLSNHINMDFRQI